MSEANSVELSLRMDIGRWTVRVDLNKQMSEWPIHFTIELNAIEDPMTWNNLVLGHGVSEPANEGASERVHE